MTCSDIPLWRSPGWCNNTFNVVFDVFQRYKLKKTNKKLLWLLVTKCLLIQLQASWLSCVSWSEAAALHEFGDFHMLE